MPWRACVGGSFGLSRAIGAGNSRNGAGHLPIAVKPFTLGSGAGGTHVFAVLVGFRAG